MSRPQIRQKIIWSREKPNDDILTLDNYREIHFLQLQNLTNAVVICLIKTAIAVGFIIK
jgi:hypothetical protein